MSKGREIFQHVCEADDEAAAVRALKEHDLCDLTVYLRQLPHSGIRGRILGLGMVEAWERYLKAHGKGGGK